MLFTPAGQIRNAKTVRDKNVFVNLPGQAWNHADKYGHQTSFVIVITHRRLVRREYSCGSRTALGFPTKGEGAGQEAAARAQPESGFVASCKSGKSSNLHGGADSKRRIALRRGMWILSRAGRIWWRVRT